MFEDKDRLTDNLVTQKYLAGGYNHAALEAANSQLLDAFTGILRDEHQIQHEIFLEMNNRGWYQPKTTNMNDLSQHINKWNQELQRVQNTAARRAMSPQQAFQGNVPQYNYQAGVNMPQQMGTPPTQTTMYRPPQSPVI
ncbi:MAG: spore coat protein [Desulfotomaculaceae bacterium]|nr:spore coat protein [Desulfotomaculaceae bacterium]